MKMSKEQEEMLGLLMASAKVEAIQALEKGVPIEETLLALIKTAAQVEDENNSSSLLDQMVKGKYYEIVLCILVEMLECSIQRRKK